MKFYWHMPSNYVAWIDFSLGGLPLISILDDEYEGINPFFGQPLGFLDKLGWRYLGEL